MLIGPALWMLPVAVGAQSSGLPAKISYNEHIQPILAENCFSCHGPDSSTRKAKLRLDRAEFSTVPRGDHEPAIKPGNAKESPLVERILSTDEDERMPPLESHKTLKPSDIALLQRWVAEGAHYEEHWSLLAPQRPAVPPLPAGFSQAWKGNPVDAFIAEKISAAGLKPNAEEGRARLLRRLTFDLTGLPPTPQELADFVADKSPGAYGRAVDRLLATDASAEHFARYWLDAVRYADTHGIHIDNYRSIWPYRDWVVDAFRRNQPFDQFTIEQIAGDLLPDASLEQKIASGFNRCLATTSEGGAIPEEYEAIYAKDRVETLSTVWLGLTTGCASCHDHKFDPITQKDFYSLTAFFRNNTMPAMDGNRYDTPPTLFVPARGDREAWSHLQASLAKLREETAARVKASEEDFQRWLASSPTLRPLPSDRTVALHLPLNEPDGPIHPLQANVREKAEGQPAVVIPERSDGLFGPAPKLNGQSIELSPPVSWRQGKAESFSFLVQVAETPSGTLLSCLDAEARGPGWEVFLENGKIGLHVLDGTAAVKVRNVSGAVLAPGKWHHVLLSFDTVSQRSRTIDVFVDGRSAVTSGISAFLPDDIVPEAPLRLGGRQAARGAPANTLTGGDVWVQDVRRYTQGFFVGEAKAMSEIVDTAAALREAPAKRTAAQVKLLRAYYFAAVDEPALELARQVDRAMREEDAMRARGGLTLVMEEKKDTEPVAHVLNRGEYSQPGEKVAATTPAVLPPLPADAPRNRLTLARWLVAPENPLTARVAMNRLWQQFFGAGLVESAGDFGVMGSRPTHPHLLDWLAVEFRESGWDFRKMARLIVTSATYRQSAVISAQQLERDPSNRLLSHAPRHRLDAEQLRDQALAASGLLVAKVGGRPVRPYQPDGIWEAVAMKESTTRYYREDHGEGLHRRSLYTLWKRTASPPAMEILNAPTREVSCVRRDRTNTPLQALVTLNDPAFVEASRHLAARALREARSFDARLDVIALRLLGRTFARDERALVRRTFDAARVTYGKDEALAKRLLEVGESASDASLPATELAAWTVVASQVMNLDESLTK